MAVVPSRRVSQPRERGDLALALLIALAAFAPALAARQLLNDGDTFWHIRAGAWMIDHGRVLFTDPFSYTFAGHAWQTHEWLSEIVLAFAFRAGGWSGVIILTASCFAATAGIVSFHLSRFLSRPATLIASLLSLAAIAPGLLARPHILALPLLALWTGRLIVARAEKRAPSPLLALVIVPWANLHASFIVGIGLAAAFAVEVAIDGDAATDRKQRIRWLVLFAGSIAAALVTPHGVNALALPLTLSQMPSLASIGEWQPTDLARLQPFEPGLVLALYILVTRRIQLGLLRALILLGLLAAALAHARHQLLLAVIGPLVIAEPLGAKLQGLSPPFRDAARALTVTLFIFAATYLAWLRLAFPVELRDGGTAPISALDRVPQSLRSAPVFNDYAFGGYLIFENVRPFIDSRAELYGDAWLKSYGELASEPANALADELARYHIAWSILARNNPIAAKLDHVPGWKRTYTDNFAVVHVREQ